MRYVNFARMSVTIESTYTRRTLMKIYPEPYGNSTIALPKQNAISLQAEKVDDRKKVK